MWRVPAPYPVFGARRWPAGTSWSAWGTGTSSESAEVVRTEVLDKLEKQGKTAEELAAAEKALGRPAKSGDSTQERPVKWKFHVAQAVLGAVAAGAPGGHPVRWVGVMIDSTSIPATDSSTPLLGRQGAGQVELPHAPMAASPAVAGKHVYVVTENGKLYGLRADDLEPVWETTVGLVGPFLSSPTVARGHVYVGSQQDGLLCIGVPGGDVVEPLWAGSLGGAGQGGSIDGQPLPEKGKFAWRFPRAKEAEAESADTESVTAPPACVKQFVYTAVHGSRNGVVCLRDDPGVPGAPALRVADRRGRGSLVCEVAAGRLVLSRGR